MRSSSPAQVPPPSESPSWGCILLGPVFPRALMEISQALGDCVFHSFQECLCSALEKSCSKNCMEVGKSFADEEEALPFLLGWETSKQHTCAKVQAPWERKARFNLWLLEESGGQARARPPCGVQGRRAVLRTTVEVCKRSSVPDHTY